MTARIFTAILLFSVGCVQQEYGQCDPPDDNLEVMYKPKTSSPFSHPFCIVCNTDIEPDDYAAWATDMGAQPPGSVEDVLPCLYVYTGNHTGPEIETLEECESLVCDGGAQYNDMVGKNNGNFDLDPILNP